MQLGLIGCGKMGQALLGGVLSAGIASPEEVTVFDPHAETLADVVEKNGVKAASDNRGVVTASEVVILCVKPYQAVEALEEACDESSGRLIISIAAGVALAQLEKAAGPNHRVIRVMPNTPALINRGASGLAAGSRATKLDIELTMRMLGAVGMVIEVAEPLLDTVTGLSGSGPAYVYQMIDALADGGVLMGLPKDKALQLAAQTVAGAAEMVLETKQHPAVLKDMVTSPGGTTAAGLAAMERCAVKSALMDAVRAATERARELGRPAE